MTGSKHSNSQDRAKDIEAPVPAIVGSRPEAGPGASPSVPEQRGERLTLAGPLILVGLLVGGVLLIILGISFFAGLFVLAWGLLYGLFGFVRSVMVLCDGEKRKVSGVAAPLLMILVALAAWCSVIHSVVMLQRSMVYRAHLRECSGNLQHLSHRMRAYAAANNGEYPSLFQHVIVPDSGRRFLCPSARRVPGDDACVDNWTSYVLIPSRTTGDPADTVLAYCPSSKSVGKPRMFCVLYVDGSVLIHSEEEFTALTMEEDGLDEAL